MRSPSERPTGRVTIGLLLIAVVVGGLMVPARPAAAETVESDYVLIRPTDVMTEDVYALGNRIQVDGTIQGDLVAAAAGEIRINGTVTGSVTAIASTVVVTGTIQGSLRVMARSVEVDQGTVGGDVAVTAWDVTSHGLVGRDVIVFSRHLTLAGKIGRNAGARLELAPLSGPDLKSSAATNYATRADV